MQHAGIVSQIEERVKAGGYKPTIRDIRHLLNYIVELEKELVDYDRKELTYKLWQLEAGESHDMYV